MLFNSHIFLFAFLPVTWVVYFLLNKRRLPLASNAWILLPHYSSMVGGILNMYH